MNIELKQVGKSYGARPAVKDVSFAIASHEFFFLLGPSGCGKTTLLRMIAGLVAVEKGEILFDGSNVNDLPAERRGTPMVFQSYALWPHLTVFENVAYGLRCKKMTAREISRETVRALGMVRMHDFRDRLPSQLSGGQQQRVAIARALAVQSKIVLFDEPLSNLDAKLRLEIRAELLEIHREHPFTAIYVTHDQEEAMTMATRMAVMNDGMVQQLGTPGEIYRQPVNPFVAEFMGPVNWLPWEGSEGARVQKGFRPNAVRLGKKGGDFSFVGEVCETQFLGPVQHIRIRLTEGISGAGSLVEIMENNPQAPRRKGDLLQFVVDQQDIFRVPTSKQSHP